jgi:hypothetical protein
MSVAALLLATVTPHVVQVSMSENDKRKHWFSTLQKVMH